MPTKDDDDYQDFNEKKPLKDTCDSGISINSSIFSLSHLISFHCSN